MKLYIQADDGTLELVTDELEEYDLDRAIAQASLCDEIKSAIERLDE